jgi:hypothetical protein
MELERIAVPNLLKELRDNIKQFSDEVSQEGIKRIFVKGREVLFKYHYDPKGGIILTKQFDHDDIYKFAFKQIRKKKRFSDIRGYVIQAPIIGVLKVLTKKGYTFQPAEFSLRFLEKKLLKKNREFSRPINILGNTIDFHLFLGAYGLIQNTISSKKVDLRENYLMSNFSDYKTDARFEKLRQIEAQCRSSNSCSENVEVLLSYHKDLILDGDIYFNDEYSKLKELDLSFSEKIKKISTSHNIMDYSFAIFPYFFQSYPDFKVGSKLTDEQLKVLTFDVLKLEIARSIKRGEFKNLLSEAGGVSDSLLLFLESSRNARDIISHNQDSLREKKLNDELNDWIYVNQKHVLDISL